MNIEAVGEYARDAMFGRHRFINFLAVGVLNTLFGYGVFALCLWLGLHFIMALAISTVLGILFNFKTTGKLVFGSRDNALIFRFVAVYLMLYCVNVAGVSILVHLGFGAYVAGLMMIPPLALISYIVNSRFVFHR